jgi:hypothetical protein
LAIQPDQKVLPSQLRGSHPDQQLSTGQPAIAGLDRPDRRVQHLIMPSWLTNSVTAAILDTGSATDPARQPAPVAATGASRVLCPPDRCPLIPHDRGLVTAIIAGQSDTYRILRIRVEHLLADSGQNSKNSSTPP